MGRPEIDRATARIRNMLKLVKPALDEDRESYSDSPRARPTTGGRAGAMPSSGPDAHSRPPTPAAQPTAKETSPDYEPAVRSEIQRVRLDLLARETERLDNRLRQILEQQQEDQDLRQELESQLSDLSMRLDALFAGDGSKVIDAPGDANLRATVKPLLQAVVRMLDATERQPSAAASPAQARQEPRPESAQAPRAPDARAGGADPPAAPRRPEAPVAQPQSTVPDRQQAKAFADAWSQLDTARTARDFDDVIGRLSKARAEAARMPEQPRAPRPEATKSPGALPPAPDPGVARRPESPRPPAAQAPPPAAKPPAPDPFDELAGDDEAIEIARLLRPTSAANRPKARDRHPKRAEGPPPRAAGNQQARAPEPLMLGTQQTPEVARPAARVPLPPRPQAVPHETDRRGTPPRQEPATRPDPAPPPRNDPPTERRENHLPPRDAAPRRPPVDPRSEPIHTALPKCLTEPWDDPDDGSFLSPGSGRHKGGRRWPFRRTRWTKGQSAGQDDGLGDAGARPKSSDDGSGSAE